MHSRGQILNALRKANIIFYDQSNNDILDKEAISLLVDFLEEQKTEEEFYAYIESLRFAKSIDEYLAGMEQSNLLESAEEFYKQHKKAIISDQLKTTTFCRKFSIKDFQRFKHDLTNKQFYPEEFYDEKLRKAILEEQGFKCGLCDKDIGNIEPHFHHIDYNKTNCKKGNLVFLCLRCHGKTNGKRDFWRTMLSTKRSMGMI